MGNATIMVMAGGTGGHVFPALAVADELLAAGATVVWMGTRQGLEARIVPDRGIPVHWVRVSALRGKGWMRAVLAPVALARACMQSAVIHLRVQPDAVLGMGGFVSGPGGLMAWLLRKPLLIHEQNAVPGLTNRLLAFLARQVMEGFAGSFPAGRKAHFTGNPVRRELCDLPEPAARFAARPAGFNLLVVGGSLGAQAINEAVPAALAAMPEALRPRVRHQAGSRNLAQARAAYADAGIEAGISSFIDDMADAYSWADLVVCRAGALTVTELTAVGVASVLVPFPYAVDDHQTANASILVEAGAAVLLPQAEMSTRVLADLLEDFARHPARLREMAANARGLARPDAARRVAESCLRAAGRSVTGEARR